MESIRFGDKKLLKYSFFFISIWFVLSVVIFGLNFVETKQWIRKVAETEAWNSYEKDLLYRRWSAMNGGVYVPISAYTKPNPYLSHIKDRDLISTTGKKLTLVNPAYMTRQVHELGALLYQNKGHITSLFPLNPENKADSWETGALLDFETGVTEKVSVETLGGVKSLRAMKPLIADEGCLSCHTEQGYSVGGMMGGISVSIPLRNFNPLFKRKMIYFVFICIGLFIILTFGTLITLRLLSRHAFELQKNEQKHQFLVKQLQQSQKMEAVGQLAGGIAHDFNNLLGIILVSADLASSQNDLSENSALFLKDISDAGEKATHLISQLNLFGRANSLKLITIDLNDLTVSFLKLLTRILGEHIELEFLPSKESLIVSADPTQLEQVIMNICLNARDAMPSGGVLKIVTSTRSADAAFVAKYPQIKEGKYAEISLEDNGEGMDSDTAAKIYDPFFTTKEKGKGTGLGLSVVFGIIRSHNGYLFFETAEGKGTNFHLFLPLIEKEDSPAPEVIVSSVKASPSAPRMDGKMVLLAEDDDMLRKMLIRILEEEGFHVIVSENGVEALDKFNQHKENLDLLIFDIMMPKMSGIDVYLKIADQCSTIPLLFSSGYSSKILPDEILSNPIVDIIWKPYLKEDFMKKIAQLLSINLKKTN